MLRKVLFQVHLWTGLTLGIVLALIGISGSLLVYDHELLALGQKPAPRAEAQGTPVSLDALIAAARQAAGEKRATVTLMLPHKPGEAALARLQKAGRDELRDGARAVGSADRRGRGSRHERPSAAGSPGGERGPTTEIYLDPVSGKVLDIRQAANNPVFAFVHDFHGNFLMGREGRSVIGWFGVAMLLLGLSGIVLWWPQRGAWRFAFGVRKNAKGFLFYRDLHGAAGIWLWLVFIVVSFSGVVIAFPDTARAMTGPAGQSFDPRRGPVVEAVEGVKPIGADAAVALVRSQLADAAITSVALPAKKNDTIRVMLGTMENGPVSVAYVDPYQKRITGWRNPPNAPAVERFAAWQRVLHAGEGWGALWRALVFVSGFLPLLFVVTGTVMWLKKRRGRRVA